MTRPSSSRLARHYGIWATKVPLFSGALDAAAKQLSKVKAVTNEGKIIYLIVGTGIGRDLRVSSDVQYIKDISLSRRPEDEPPKRMIELPPLMNDGLFIDLTSLFSRLGVPLADVELLKELAEEVPGNRAHQARVKHRG